MGAILEIADLSVNLKTGNTVLNVLDKVSLAVSRGRIVGIVGESGCGKSTLARAVLGALQPGVASVTGGSIKFQGVDLLTLPREVLRREYLGRRITFIPQEPASAFHSMFTIGVQIEDLLRQKCRPAPDANPRNMIVDALRAVQLPDPEQILDKLPHQLSGGQLQRVMIAMALLPGPELLIADEPTTALDVTIQAQILKLLHGLVLQRQLSLIIATHDLGVAYEICDDIVVMFAGQDVEHAPASAFFQSPIHHYTRHLIDKLPKIGTRWSEGRTPEAVPPLLTATGCRYHLRCSAADSECRAQRPEPDVVAAGHVVRCFHPLLLASHE